MVLFLGVTIVSPTVHPNEQSRQAEAVFGMSNNAGDDETITPENSKASVTRHLPCNRRER